MASWLPSALTSWLPGSAGEPTPREGEVIVTNLWLYPVKSCRGFQIKTSPVTPTGLLYDREFMIIDQATHRFLTARTVPKMILIETAISYSDQTLTITVPATSTTPATSHTVPLTRPTLSNPGSSEFLTDAFIWGSSFEGWSVGDDALREALSAFMGKEVLLVQLTDSDKRETGRVEELPWVEEGGGLEYHEKAVVSWADEYPILLTNKGSLRAIDEAVMTDSETQQANSKFDRSKWASGGVEMHRFRGNIIVDGAEAWDEEAWSEIRLDGKANQDPLELIVAIRCGRCQLPNVDPESAIRDPVVPDKFMETLGRRTNPGIPAKLVFGVQCVPKRTLGKVSVGDRVTVLRRFDEKREDGHALRFEDQEYQ